MNLSLLVSFYFICSTEGLVTNQAFELLLSRVSLLVAVSMVSTHEVLSHTEKERLLFGNKNLEKNENYLKKNF